MNKNGFTLIELIIVIAVIVGGGMVAFGWIHNIIMLTTCNLNPVTMEPIMRVVGIPFVPLGVVMGFIGHF